MYAFSLFQVDDHVGNYTNSSVMMLTKNGLLADGYFSVRTQYVSHFTLC